MRPALPALLAGNAGFVDTAGFLALHGLFTTHVTGNFVTLGAAVAHGTSGVVAKLLALPVFCLVILLIRLLDVALTRRGRPALKVMFAIQFALLLAGAALALRFGPFPDGDAPAALATGMVLVAAMAIQNAAHRTHLTTTPATTVMTLSTTQVMIDVADLIRGVTNEARAAAHKRLGPTVLGVACFAAGCIAAALLYVVAKERCFIAPPVIAALALAALLARGDEG